MLQWSEHLRRNEVLVSSLVLCGSFASGSAGLTPAHPSAKPFEHLEQHARRPTRLQLCEPIALNRDAPGFPSTQGAHPESRPAL